MLNKNKEASVKNSAEEETSDSSENMNLLFNLALQSAEETTNRSEEAVVLNHGTTSNSTPPLARLFRAASCIDDLMKDAANPDSTNPSLLMSASRSALGFIAPVKKPAEVELGKPLQHKARHKIASTFKSHPSSLSVPQVLKTRMKGKFKNATVTEKIIDECARQRKLGAKASLSKDRASNFEAKLEDMITNGYSASESKLLVRSYLEGYYTQEYLRNNPVQNRKNKTIFKNARKAAISSVFMNIVKVPKDKLASRRRSKGFSEDYIETYCEEYSKVYDKARLDNALIIEKLYGAQKPQDNVIAQDVAENSHPMMSESKTMKRKRTNQSSSSSSNSTDETSTHSLRGIESKAKLDAQKIYAQKTSVPSYDEIVSKMIQEGLEDKMAKAYASDFLLAYAGLNDRNLTQSRFSLRSFKSTQLTESSRKKSSSKTRQKKLDDLINISSEVEAGPSAPMPVGNDTQVTKSAATAVVDDPEPAPLEKLIIRFVVSPREKTKEVSNEESSTEAKRRRVDVAHDETLAHIPTSMEVEPAEEPSAPENSATDIVMPHNDGSETTSVDKEAPVLAIAMPVAVAPVVFSAPTIAKTNISSNLVLLQEKMNIFKEGRLFASSYPNIDKQSLLTIIGDDVSQAYKNAFVLGYQATVAASLEAQFKTSANYLMIESKMQAVKEGREFAADNPGLDKETLLEILGQDFDDNYKNAFWVGYGQLIQSALYKPTL